MDQVSDLVELHKLLAVHLFCLVERYELDVLWRERLI